MSKLSSLMTKQLDDLSKKITQGISRADMEKVAALIGAAIDQNFSFLGRWNGDESNIGLFSGGTQRWQPLVDSTLKRYKYLGIDLRPTLWRSFDSQPMKQTIEVIPDGKKSVKITVNKPYAAIHQFGGNTGKGLKTRIPARPFITLPPSDVDRIMAFLIKSLRGLV